MQHHVFQLLTSLKEDVSFVYSRLCSSQTSLSVFPENEAIHGLTPQSGRKDKINNIFVKMHSPTPTLDC